MPQQFYFAWIDEPEVFDPAVHNRNDEYVYSHTISQEEGDFAALEAIIKNPRIGLLNVGRKVWCYYSYEDRSGTITPLFKGRLIGIPTNVFDTTVTLEFTAQPSNFNAQKQALAETLKVAPYWCSLLIDPQSWDDPDTILEGYTKLWHIHPVTHVVTVSDIIVPEDGTIEYTAEQIFYDGLGVSLSQVPLRTVSVSCDFPWTQQAQGSVSFTKAILQNFPADVGSDAGGYAGNLISSFTFQGLSGSWPQAGAEIGDGWKVTVGTLNDVSFLAVPAMPPPEVFGTDTLPVAVPEGSIYFPPQYAGTSYGGVDGSTLQETITQVVAPIGYGVPTLEAQYTASRDFVQTVTFTLNTDTQAIATAAGADEVLAINLTANPVSNIDEDNSLPIVSLTNRSFVELPKGQQAIEHLVLLARAQLVARSRAVQVTSVMPFENGIAASLRKGALFPDQRLPGGQAEGKLITWTHTMDGDSGTCVSTLQIGCAIGHGGSQVGAAGEPDYVVEGAIPDSIQTFHDTVTLVGTNDVTYTMPTFGYFDDGLNFSAGLTVGTAMISLTIAGSASEQRAALLAAAGTIPDQAALTSALQSMPTVLSIELSGMSGGPFLGTVPLTVSDLVIPKQIDLEAASV